MAAVPGLVKPTERERLSIFTVSGSPDIQTKSVALISEGTVY
jgi:hypothetical protein